MSDELEIETDDDSGKGLRAQLTKALADIKKAEDRAAAAEKRVAERQLADVLAAKKIPSGFAKVIASEGVDPSDETAVENWWKENAGNYGVSLEAATPDQSQVHPDQAAFNLMQQQQFQTPVQSTAVQNLEAQAEELIARNGTTEELMKLFGASGL